ncbi:hypothetical protein D3C75_918420 [compost metagenome]
MIPCFFVGLLVELAHQLFEQVAHLQIADGLGREVNVCGAELLDDEVEPVRLVQLGDLRLKFELIEDVAGTWREALDIGDQVAGNVGRIAQQLLKCEATGVEQLLLAVGGGDAGQRLFQCGAGDVFVFQTFFFVQNLLLVLGQHKVETAQNNQRQHHSTVLWRTIGPTKLVGDIPDEAD